MLGVGGVRMLRALRMPVQRYHLNEGHSALLTLELLREHGAVRATSEQSAELVQAVRRECIFTTHTPVEAGHDLYPYDLVEQWLGGLCPTGRLRPLAGTDCCNLTRPALSLGGWVNGVAERHPQTSRSLFPGYEVHAITNGVHALSWTATPLRALYDSYIPNWCHEPALLVRVLSIPDGERLEAHARAKRALLQVPGCGSLEPHRFTIGFGRRMTSDKRPGLLLTDLARLRAIGRRFPLQVIVARKAHPQDVGGKRIIEELRVAMAALAPDACPVVFLPDHGVRPARAMVAGVDLWLNAPQPPLEASGTSGKKAAPNGVPTLSVLDGRWLEGCAKGETGWAIGSDGDADDARTAASPYDKLERKVLPTWTSGGPAWAVIMKAAIAPNGLVLQQPSHVAPLRFRSVLAQGVSGSRQPRLSRHPQHRETPAGRAAKPRVLLRPLSRRLPWPPGRRCGPPVRPSAAPRAWQRLPSRLLLQPSGRVPCLRRKHASWPSQGGAARCARRLPPCGPAG